MHRAARRQRGILLPTQPAATPERPSPPAPERAAIRRPSTPLTVLLFIGALLTVGLAVPQVGIVVAWPLIFFVPGWPLLGRLLPELGLPGRIGASVVVSVFIPAHPATWSVRSAAASTTRWHC